MGTARFKSHRRRALLWLLLTLWTFGLVEGAAAVYFLYFSRTFYRPVYLERRDDHWLWRTEHDDWGGWHRPSSTASHSHHCFSVSYASNSYGARDRERSRTASARRAVFLGDSFIEGYAVDEDKRVSSLLEQALAFEMMNFGMTHFGPLQYHILYDRLARTFDHDLVVVGLLPDNDFIDNDGEQARKMPTFGRHYRPLYAKDGGVFYPRSRPDPSAQPFARYADLPEGRRWHDNLRRMLWLYGLRQEISTNVMMLNHPTGSQYIGYLEHDPVRIANVVGSLRAIQQLAAPRRLLVVFLPDYKSWTYVQSHPGSYQTTVAARMGKVMDSHGIQSVDLLKTFMDRRLDKDALYLPCDGHWNNAGHRAAFEVLRPVVDDLLRTSTRIAAGAPPTRP
jgi:hypothetical protein